jgi:lipopolysaccharide transport system ATP-binding protein
MSDPVISVEGLSKRYVIGHELRHDSLRDTLHHTARKLWRRLRWGTGFQTEEFWALRDVSFEVKQGEVVGIIGRNGAGKSTLLKILSRITEPTEGTVTIKGRVASLLEVGTGFHPELSGRENVFLNGAILGMSRAEIRRKFDEIVAFAEVEKFLDTPVKHYSSGMYVRLAFAVAAHLEPEILIVDEVLAVGDAAFQKKCLGKMEKVASGGRTILFVSHNIEALRATCRTGILLESGQLKMAGAIQDVIGRYHRPQVELNAVFAPVVHKPSIIGLSVDQARLAAGDLLVRLRYRSPFALQPAVGGIILTTVDGRPLFGTNMRTHPPTTMPGAGTAGTCTLEVPGLSLHSGIYALSAWLGDKTQDYDSKLDAVSFEFVSPRHYLNRPPLHVIGPVDLPCRWSTRIDEA